MKREQVLSVEQMQHLQKLRLELKETTLYWARCVDNNPRAATHYGKWVLIKGNNTQTVGLMHWEFIPACTLQDILDMLLESIGAFDLYMRKICSHYVIGYCFGNETKGSCMEKNIIDAAYKLLVWCIEEGYVKTEGGGK